MVSQPIRYVSTRDVRGFEDTVDSLTAIRRGIAPDGGLYVPTFLPRFEPDFLASLLPLGYAERAERILASFLPEIAPSSDTGSAGELHSMLLDAYGSQWDTTAVAPVRPFEELAFLELWHGPTCAFKDLALQLLPRLLKAAARHARSRAEIVVLVATSGDTGKAALAGFADVPGTRIIVFYPKDGVSQIQERQMTTQTGSNVHVIGVRGNFDDAQAGVKAIFTDEGLRRELEQAGKEFSSANSINWGRLVPQIVYYFSAYADLVAAGRVKPGDPINVVVPSGNFGNILAAHYARRMGLPVTRLICASNLNHVLTDFIRTGIYDRRREFHRTSSPSMDILISSNVERLLYELVDGDPAVVRRLLGSLVEEGYYELPDAARSRLAEEFWGAFATEAETRAALAWAFRELGYVVDPHTAVAVHVYRQYVAETGDRTYTLIAATASPFKFTRTVVEALFGPESVPTPGGQDPRPVRPGVRSDILHEGRLDADDFTLLDYLASRLGQPLPAGLAGLKHRPVLHRTVCGPDRGEMTAVVRQLLGLAGPPGRTG